MKHLAALLCISITILYGCARKGGPDRPADPRDSNVAQVQAEDREMDAGRWTSSSPTFRIQSRAKSTSA